MLVSSLLAHVAMSQTNLAVNRPVTVSSTEFPQVGSQAVDGSLTTRWASNVGDPQWIYVDLGATANITRVKITWETALASNYQLQTSPDALTWTDIKTITGNSALVNDHTGLTGSGRYLRMLGTARGTIFGYSIFELEVYGTIPCATTPPTVTNGSRCGTGTVALSASSGTAGTFRWYSAISAGTLLRTSTAGLTSDTYTPASISTTTTYYVTFHNGTCESSPRTAVIATVNAVPATPTGTAGARCGVGTVTLSATSATAGTFIWYSASTGGTVLRTSGAGVLSDSYTTPSITATTNYFLAVRSAANCESARRQVTATVNAVPTAPTVTPGSTCGPGTVTLAGNTATAGTFKWYDAASGGNLLQTSAAGQTTNNYTTPSLSATATYYVTVTNTSNCESTRTAVVATVNANSPATAPVVTNSSRCGTGTVSLTATSTTSGTFRWYNALVGGTLLRTSGAATTDNYTTPSLSATTIYYVTFNNGTCESTPRRAVTATVNTAAVAPTVTAGARCGTGTVSLSASSATTGIFRWYTALTGGSAVQTSAAGQTSNSYTTPSLSATTSYFVTFTTAAGCESTPRTQVNATVTPAPSPFVVGGSGNLASGPQNITLSGSQSGTSYQLLKNSVAFGSAIAGTNAQLSWAVAEEGTYTVQANVGNCSVLMTGSATILGGSVPDQVEFNALKDLYTNTNGGNWTNKTNWPTNWPTTTTAAQMGTWAGITVTNGDITGIEMPANNLVGPMPASIGNLRELRNLIVYANSISGQFPAEWSTLTKLEYFDFRHTLVSGSAPPYLKNFPNLVWLTINSANLTGAFPDYSGLQNMQIFGVGGNLTPGPIPSYIQGYSNLLQLWGQGSNWTGPIPQWFGNMSSLVAVVLTTNRLTGQIPANLAALPNLTLLSLADNQLTGALPEAFANGANMQHLNVSNNQLAGALPFNYFNGWNKLVLLNLSGNNFTSVPNLALSVNKANLTVNVENNRLDFTAIEPMVGQGLSAFTFSPQKNINDVTSLQFSVNQLTIPAREMTAGTTVQWEKQQTDGTWQNINAQNQNGAQASTFAKSNNSRADEGIYRWSMSNSSVAGLTIQSDPINLLFSPTIKELIDLDSLNTVFIPELAKVTRNGRIKPSTTEVIGTLSTLAGNDVRTVPLPCDGNNYFVGLQLYYDLSNQSTESEWASQLEISLLNGVGSQIWSTPLLTNSKNQTFISTNFYQQPINCYGNYTFKIEDKLIAGQAPQSAIVLKVILYKVEPATYSFTSNIDLHCSNSGELTIITGTDAGVGATEDAGVGATEYDLEWVSIADHEGYTPAPGKDPFLFKEPVRVTIPTLSYQHRTFYQTGKIWYRARAVGYNPQYPDHRIVGDWVLAGCSPITIVNPEPQKNWQVQTVFAEEGKNKKVVQYFDGTLRTRQSQTNLSTEGVTLAGETLYDFEGRKSVEILAAPSQLNYNSSLTFKLGLNNFQAVDPVVAANTSSTRKKFHYDNRQPIGQPIENSTLTTGDGAGNYYSVANTRISMHSMLIPNGEGYVYSQTEYLNDGSGRIRRQSGVGKEFRIDGSRATQYYYGEAAQVELRRLFGTNVGNASHYKKNLVVDANGQVSVSYHDQSDKVVASALAGDKPGNVDPLPSFTALPNDLISVDISDKNQRRNGLSITSHKILNSSHNTPYTFSYELTALGATIGELACPTCTFEFGITIIDPDGKFVDLGPVAGNESPDSFSYLKKNITAASCSTAMQVVQFSLPLAKIGDYTITKTLKAVELTFEQMKTMVQQKASVLARIQQIRNSYVPDATQCEICATNDCTDTDKSTSDAINKIASLDCENIKNKIIETLVRNRNDPDYYPTDSEIRSDPNFCRYQLCVLDKASDVFDKQLALIPNWSTAVQKGYTTVNNTPVDKDPFFNEKGLSGYGYKNKMVERLNNVFIGDVNTNLKTPRPILEVLEPLNPLYYIDSEGNPTNSTSTGYHILYYELMKERPADYAAQLDVQRWAMYRWLYVEAKRKTKLNMPAYSIDCPKSKEELEKTDNIPTTEDGANNWAEGLPLRTVSEEQISMTYYMLTLNCARTAPLDISVQDSNDIKSNLRIYFSTNANNFYRLILKNDLALDANNQIINSSLRAISTILAKYNGCESALNKIAVDDPLVCQKYKTITFPVPASLPNLVVNPTVSPTTDCTPYITNNGCYNGWSAQSGAPQVIEPGVIRLNGQRCNVVSSAVGGTVSLPDGLVPGKKYRFSVTYRANTLNDNVYCQFFNNDGYGRADGSTFKLGQTLIPITETCSASSTGSNLLFNPCPDPGALRPSIVLTNGVSSDKIWIKQGVPVGGWITDNVIFTATEKSKNFVFSTIPNSGSLGVTNPSNLTTWGNNGTFENILVKREIVTYNPVIDENGNGYFEKVITTQWIPTNPVISQMFFETNARGSITGSSARSGSMGLSISNNSGPQSKAGVLLKFNALQSNSGASTFIANVWVRNGATRMSNNAAAVLYISFPGSDWEVLSQNQVPFGAIDNCWANLKVRIARKPGVGLVPLPDYFTISTNMTDSETNTSGSLSVDDISINGIDYTSATQSIDLKDITIKEYYEPTRTFCIQYPTPTVPDYIAQYRDACLVNEARRKARLAEIAVDNYLEDEVTELSNLYRTQCLNGATEKLRYEFRPLEYHYTLYYYDQAGNLVQTVPPEGVVPVPMDRLGIDNPQHKLITRYKYNSLNQLIYQTTPDAGESEFLYNSKSQLRLSQNAQQKQDNHFSYTKYDEQGRITEVGEMTASGPIANFKTAVEDAQFPQPALPGAPAPNTYLLTDVTLTHYDFANTNPQWASLVNVNVNRNTLTNTGGGYWQDHAFTSNVLPANQDGYIEFRLRNGDVEVGLSSAPQSTIYTVDFGIMLQYNAIYLTQNSNANAIIGSYGPTDLIRIERVGTTIFYKKNGSIFYTSAIPSTTALYGHVHMNMLGSVITDIAMGILPSPNSYASGNQATFIQQNLRNRVSWVEVLDKGKTDATTTYYSYDIHGNVKSLVQQIPDLPNKRTDYVYDLVSGKVDFVMYQYGEKDQFIHRYEYDADNRITTVKTSTDGFMWDNDAEYQYYLHGPLARTALGLYKVQGLDYYYTLQGWLKGVNSPTGASAQANDPGGDGHGTSKFAKDVMAFNLGYYQGDYKPISGNSSTLIEQTSPLLWRGAGGEALDLFNGNIAWMATDLSAIPSAKTDRNKGVQAMQYNYDQLNRIVRSRSRTFSGVIDPRTGSPAPYDENYTYDANGNILTLLRNNELGAVADNFTYQYYTGTNRLRGVKPITDSVTYRAAVTSNSKVYSKITVTGDAYVPDGADVTLRATENIYLHPRFKKAGGKSFRASITDEGTYQYDAIGNLIADNSEGTKISWTPYGKVREVKTKGDSVTVSYRYDASGNRIQKTVRTLPSDNIIWKDVAYAETTPTSVRSTVSGCCGGAVSAQLLPANTDGWLEFTTRDIVGTKGIGFSAVNTDNSPYSIDYSFYMSQYALYAFEEGQYKGFYNFAAGDLFRIERTNGVIRYYQNGNLLYTSLVPSTTALMVDVGTDALGTSIENIRTSFTSKPATTIITNYVRDASGNVMSIYQQTQAGSVGNAGIPIEWIGMVNTAVRNGNLIQPTESNWGTSYATSAQQLPANTDGWVESTFTEQNSYSMFGLAESTYGHAGHSPNFGIYATNDPAMSFSIVVFENGGQVFTLNGKINEGDKLRVERVGSSILYKRNGVTFYTSTSTTSVPLFAKASFSVRSTQTFYELGILVKPICSFGTATTQALMQMEVPIYGSARLGQYLGGRKEGQLRLGKKNYELSNHLGNVLAVVTDNINMTAAEGVFATVVSSTDYYPFGLEMKGRTYSNDKYRYGFNGKEKDNAFAITNNYDYGFRIYNPSIAKFLSVDPLTKSYPWYTPYQFAGNTPIQAIDLDGLEKVTVTKYAYLIGYIPKLKKSEWYVIEDQVDWKSFSSAAKYNISSNNPGAYQNIEDRHNWYVWAAQNAKDNYWFSAASNVTSWSMVGGAEMLGSGIFISKDAKDLLVGANKFLLKENFKNFGKYAMGEGPVTWNGISYGHLSGRDLDNQMVVIEMSTLQGYLDDFKSDYIKKNGEEKWDNLRQNLNSLFSNKFLRKFTPEANKYAQDEFKKEFGEDEKFDFTNLEHRIFQGQKMAEFDRKNAEKKKQ